jgi:hypothetical protein
VKAFTRSPNPLFLGETVAAIRLSLVLRPQEDTIEKGELIEGQA